MKSDDDITGLSTDEYKKVRSVRLTQLKAWQIIPNWIWAVIVIIGCFLLLRETSTFWIKLLSFIFVIYSAVQLGSRIWKVDDFMDGYEQGYSDGVYRRDKIADDKDKQDDEKS